MCVRASGAGIVGVPPPVAARGLAGITAILDLQDDNQRLEDHNDTLTTDNDRLHADNTRLRDATRSRPTRSRT